MLMPVVVTKLVEQNDGLLNLGQEQEDLGSNQMEEAGESKIETAYFRFVARANEWQ